MHVLTEAFPSTERILIKKPPINAAAEEIMRRRKLAAVLYGDKFKGSVKRSAKTLAETGVLHTTIDIEEYAWLLKRAGWDPSKIPDLLKEQYESGDIPEDHELKLEKQRPQT